MYIAQMETHSFSFTALGETEEAAMSALAHGWVKHRLQYSKEDRLSIFSAKDAIEQYAAFAFQLDLGECARDYEKLT
jgi:hypothetical protein